MVGILSDYNMPPTLTKRKTDTADSETRRCVRSIIFILVGLSFFRNLKRLLSRDFTIYFPLVAILLSEVEKN